MAQADFELGDLELPPPSPALRAGRPATTLFCNAVNGKTLPKMLSCLVCLDPRNLDCPYPCLPMLAQICSKYPSSFKLVSVYRGLPAQKKHWSPPSSFPPRTPNAV